MQRNFLDVNNAFFGLVRSIHKSNKLGPNPYAPIPLVSESSRAGEVMRIDEPVLIRYDKPKQRVLYNPGRDANPFFHLYEALWMLAGRNDVESLAYYNSKIGEVASDDGTTFNGAYGYRWRHAFQEGGGIELDQLTHIIGQLRSDPGSRRIVLAMWSPELDLIATTKDKCCNTHAYFAIRNGRLDMTVCNRSNDLIWGLLGANYVHFTILQEWLAAAVGVPVGIYYHFTNNLHVYQSTWKPESYIGQGYQEAPYKHWGWQPFPLVAHNAFQFRQECEILVQSKDYTYDYSEPFINQVAIPMLLAFDSHKVRRYGDAYESLKKVASPDWKSAGHEWIRLREENYYKGLETKGATH